MGVDDHLRCGRFGGQQALGLQVGPQRWRDLELEHLDALIDLSGRAAADNHASDRGVAERKLHRCRLERDAVAAADIADPLRALD